MTEGTMEKTIAGYIGDVLTRGFLLSYDTIRFIAATWDVPEHLWIEDFHAAMALLDDPETLVDLIVYPDERIQMGLEPILAHPGAGPPDERAVIHHLGGSSPQVTIILPDDAGAISLSVEEFFLTRFVKRLHLEKVIPKSLCDTLPPSFSPESRYRFFVYLRHSHIDYRSDCIDAISRYVEMFPESHPAFWDGLSFVLEFLTEIPDARDMKTALINRRKVLSHHIDQKKAMDDHLAKVNMETFLLTGNRVCGIDVARATDQITLIRSILYHVYNVFDLPGEHDKDVSFGTFTRKS